MYGRGGYNGGYGLPPVGPPGPFGAPNMPPLMRQDPMHMQHPPSVPLMGHGVGIVQSGPMVAGQPIAPQPIQLTPQGGTLPGNITPFTVWVGGIADGIKPIVIQQLLSTCGLCKWKQTEGKAFGFCDFTHANSVVNAVALLTGRSIKGSALKVKVGKEVNLRVETYKTGPAGQRDEKERDMRQRQIQSQIEIILKGHSLLDEDDGDGAAVDAPLSVVPPQIATEGSGSSTPTLGVEADQPKQRADQASEQRVIEGIKDIRNTKQRQKEEEERRVSKEQEREEALERRRRTEQLHAQRELRDKERKYEEWEQSFQSRVKRDKEWEKEREEALPRRIKKMERLLETYDDEYDDDRYYREKDMDRLISDRARERKYDDRDREKEARETKDSSKAPAEGESTNPEDEETLKRSLHAESGSNEGVKKAKLDTDAKKAKPDTDVKKAKPDTDELIKQLISEIPSGKEELFVYPIKYELITDELLSLKLIPWVQKKIAEYIGEEEATLVNHICDKIKERQPAEALEEEMSMILDDDAAIFVRKLWRNLVYETELVARGLVA